MTAKKRRGQPRKQAATTSSNENSAKAKRFTDEEGRQPSTARDAVEYLFVFAAQLGVYAATLYPSIPGGDSGELVAVACELGVAHPPGYPLYTMLCHVFMQLVPFGTPAWRANLLSALLASAAGTCVCWVTNNLCPSSFRGAGVVATALFSFTRLTWMYSTTAEVFAMNNFFVALMLVCLVYYIQKPGVGRATVGAFVCALSTTNQHTAVLFLVVMVPWVLWHGRAFLFTPAAVTKLILASLLGILPYIYIPISATLNHARTTWGDQRTLAGFLKHFLRKEYGTFDLGSRSSTSTTFAERIMLHMRDLSQETFHLIFPLVVVALLGMVLERRRVVKEVRVPLLGMLVFYELFFNWRANLSIENRLLAGVHERFWMQPNMILCVFAGLGFSYAGRWLARFMSFNVSKTFWTTVAVALAATMVVNNFAARDESNNTAVADMGRSLLSGVPEDSIFLTRGDLPGNSARYLHFCENVRPDLRILDLEMMTYPWYVPMLGHKFEGVVFPGREPVYQLGKDNYQMLSFFDANYDRFPIFVFEGLNEDDPTWQHKYELRHFGQSKRVVRKGDTFPRDEWIRNATRAVPNHPVPEAAKYDDRTWEAVVREGYLASGVLLAISFEQRAREATTLDDALAYNKAAYKVYDDLLKREEEKLEEIPAYWYKNFGLIASNLYQMSSEEKYKQKKIEQWLKYIRSGANDSQINDMISILRADGADI